MVPHNIMLSAFVARLLMDRPGGELTLAQGDIGPLAALPVRVTQGLTANAYTMRLLPADPVLAARLAFGDLREIERARANNPRDPRVAQAAGDARAAYGEALAVLTTAQLAAFAADPAPPAELPPAPTSL